MTTDYVAQLQAERAKARLLTRQADNLAGAIMDRRDTAQVITGKDDPRLARLEKKACRRAYRRREWQWQVMERDLKLRGKISK